MGSPTISLMRISLYRAAFCSKDFSSVVLLASRAEYISFWAALAAATASADAKNRIITSPINMVLKIEALR